MFDNIEDLPIRPAFGTLQGVMKGVVLNAKQTPGCEWISAQPPLALAHLHRPARISNIWEKVITLLRNPVEVHHLSGDLDIFQILGNAVIARSASGCLTPHLWHLEGLDQPYLERARASTVILQGMPWRWVWLNRMLWFAKQEYSLELQFLNKSATSESLDAYFDWVNRLFRKKITQHADMAQVRRRIACTLKLDPTALRRAHCGVPRGYRMSLATVQDYNDALLMHDELDQLERDAPQLLPLYMALGTAPDFPNEGEPVQRLKSFLLAHGFTESHWRFIAKSKRRLLQPMRHIYLGKDAVSETMDYLRILCALGFRHQIPEPIVNALFAVWGHPADRKESYLKLLSVHTSYPHIMKAAVARFGTISFDDLEEELLAIIRWAWDIKLKLTKDQRRLGWQWLIKQARAHLETLDAKEFGQKVTWSIPAEAHTVGVYQLRFLASSYDLWEEAKTMRHCADSYVGRCIATNARLASVTRNQRRVATAMFDWTGDELNLTQISGKANRPVATALSKSLETLHIDGAKENFEAPTEEFHIRRAQGAEEPFDIGAAIEEQIQPQGTATLITYTKANDMTALLTNTGDFIREVEITPVRAIADTFHMEFRSRLLTAKNPLANQRNFSLSLDRDGLLELKALIERSLEELPC